MQPVYGDGVSGLDRVGDLRGEVRRCLNFGAVGQDQPVDVASRRQRELLDLATLSRKLLRVVEWGLPTYRVRGLCRKAAGR